MGKKYLMSDWKFTKWIEDNILDFQLVEKVNRNPSCDFFVYRQNALNV